MLGLLDHDLGLLDRGDVDQAAVEDDRALAFFLGLLHGLDDALGLGHLLRGGAVDRIGEGDLARVDRPLALAAEAGRTVGPGVEALGIGEVAERPVDGAQALGRVEAMTPASYLGAGGGVGFVLVPPLSVN